MIIQKMSQTTGSEQPELNVKTRSGRVSKPPTRYEPVEQVEDDYADEDYDSNESDISSQVSYDSEEEISDEDEEDDLDGFVVPDKSETSETDTDGEPSVPPAKGGRTAVKKRPVPGKRVAGS